MEQDDEEFEKLLGEIPRATSAPPHAEELQRALALQQHQQQHLLDKGGPPLLIDQDVKDGGLVIKVTGKELYSPFSTQRSSSLSLDSLSKSPPFYSAFSPDEIRQIELHQNLDAQIIPCNHPVSSQLQHSIIRDGRTSFLPNEMLHHERSLSASFANMKLHDGSAEALPHIEEGNRDGTGALEHVMHHSTSNSEFGTLMSSGVGSDLAQRFTSAPEASMSTCLPRSLTSFAPLSQAIPSSAKDSLGIELQNNFGKPAKPQPRRVMANVLVQNPLKMDTQCNGFTSPLETCERGYSSTMLQFPQQQNNYSCATLNSATANRDGLYYPPDASGTLVNGQAQLLSNMDLASSFITGQLQEIAAQQQLDDRARYRQHMQQHFLLRQQHLQKQQARFHACLQGQPSALGSVGYSRLHAKMSLSDAPPMSTNDSFASDFLHQQHLARPTLVNPDLACMRDWKQHQSLPPHTPLPPPPHPPLPPPPPPPPPLIVLPEAIPPTVCRYFAQGFCSRGEACPFTHPSGPYHGKPFETPSNNGYVHDPYLITPKAIAHKSPRNAQSAPGAFLPGPSKKDPLSNGHFANAHMLSNGGHLATNKRSDVDVNGFGAVVWKEVDHEMIHPPDAQHHVKQQQQQQQSPKYATLEEVEGRIYAIAKDQHGCRFLQRKCEERSPEDVEKIFIEVIDQIVELMTDPFGNYLVQKLLEVCNESQRLEILYRVTGNSQLVTISLNMHGTRAVQKLIETLSSSEHVAMVISSLRQGVVTLIKDLNGNHVVQRCLQRLSTEDSQFIFDVAASHCVEIATHRHGCCVLQRCVDFSSGQQRERLVAEIASNALILSQDPFGNYVVQYILDLGLAWATMQVVACLDGNYAHLAMQKFSSNVVEKCLKLAGDDSRAHIVQELISSSRIAQLLQDPYANYVIQSALTVSKGSLHTGLVDAIRPHLSALRSSPYGKRILSRTNLKK